MCSRQPLFNWRDFLEGWSQELLAAEEIRRQLPPEIVSAHWLGYAGAGEQELTRAELRLGCTLPSSYREFLRATNGWRHTGFFIDKLWPAEEIEWFHVRHQVDWIDAWQIGANYGGPAEPVPDAAYFVYDETQRPEMMRAEFLDTALEISPPGDSAIYLLNPRVLTSDGEWEAWFLASWLPGAHRYRSFAEMMQAERRKFKLGW